MPENIFNSEFGLEHCTIALRARIKVEYWHYRNSRHQYFALKDNVHEQVRARLWRNEAHSCKVVILSLISLAKDFLNELSDQAIDEVNDIRRELHQFEVQERLGNNAF